MHMSINNHYVRQMDKIIKPRLRGGAPANITHSNKVPTKGLG